MVAAVPWMVREWRGNRQAQNEKKAVERYMEKKKKLEERLAKQEAVGVEVEEKETEA